MPTALIFTGMACGALLAATGLTLWDGSRQVPRLSRAVRAVRWLAGALLLVGALFAWPLTPISYPILMAAIIAPPETRRRHHSHWSNVMLVLPALILAGASMFWGSTFVGTFVGTFVRVEIETSNFLVAVPELAVVVCGGLGARALGQSLRDVAAPPPHAEELALPTAITYALLTLLVSSTALVNLWQRGAIWGGTLYQSGEGGLAGAWLAWSAVWLIPRRPRWLRAILTTVAASLLIALAAGR